MNRPWIYWAKGIGYTLAAIGLLMFPPLAFTRSGLLIGFFVFVHLALLALGILYLVKAIRIWRRHRINYVQIDIDQALAWVKEGRIPHRLLTDEERSERERRAGQATSKPDKSANI